MTSLSPVQLAASPLPVGPAVPTTDVVIGELRSQIDEVDRAILDLLQRRLSLSRQVQATRVAAGGVRVELARERQVVSTYRASLGPQGTVLASALLRTCRGPL